MAEQVAVEHQIVIRSLLGHTYGGATALRMAAATNEQFFPAGKVIYEAGDPARYVYFLVQGRVELSHPGEKAWSFNDRGVFGILDAELERPHARTARATSDVRVIAIRADDWHDIIEDNFDYTRWRISRNAQDLMRKGLELAPHAGFDGVPPHHREDAMPYIPHHHVLETTHADPFERLLVLHLTDVFERAGIQALTRLAASARELVVEEDDVIVDQGDNADALLVVASGTVAFERHTPPISVTFGERRLIGGYAGLGQGHWPATVRAISPTHVLSIAVEDLYDVMEDHFDVVRSVMGFLAVERDRLQRFKW